MSDWTEVTIREASAADRTAFKRPKYVVCNPSNGQDYAVFGLVQGGETREEALFWAVRLASKNGLRLVVPESFDGVEAALPDDRP